MRSDEISTEITEVDEALVCNAVGPVDCCKLSATIRGNNCSRRRTHTDKETQSQSQERGVGGHTLARVVFDGTVEHEMVLFSQTAEESVVERDRRRQERPIRVRESGVRNLV